jgi:2-polyprenyl-6-methoxyphenol hydroxylase-like FAD-dependent oxidoreductase
MTSRLGNHAVTIGGSIAGLLGARVLADYFDRVTVLERDRIEDRPAIHKSIPQGNHVHTLLQGGQQVMSELYPGFTAMLRESGAVPYRPGRDVVWFLPDGKAYTPRGAVHEPRDLGLESHSQSRALLEHLVRRQTAMLPNISLESGSVARGLIADGGHVRGVRREREDKVEDVDADLVIDAGGRGSQAPRWLNELGFQAPDETVIGVDLAYSSSRFRIPSSGGLEPLIFVGSTSPRSPNAAGMFLLEDGSWLVSLAGRFRNYPPTDEAGFLAFAQALQSPIIYDLITDGERVADFTHHRFPTSIQRHYERLTEFPERFVTLGDAICSFNPVYGQGMSSAAMQTAALRNILDERARQSRGLEGLAADFFPRAASVISTPWTLAAILDFIYPKTQGERPADLKDSVRYLNALESLQNEDVEVQRVSTEVLHLLKPLSVLWQEPLRRQVQARMKLRKR